MACITEQCTQTIQELDELESTYVEKHEEIQVDFENEETQKFRKHLEYQRAVKELERRKARVLGNTFRLSLIR
jgi:hypothetical protein